MSSSWCRDRRTSALALAVGTSLLLAGTAGAQIAHKPVVETDGDLKVTVTGQVVSVDPKTGRLRPPSPQQQQTLLETLRRVVDPDPSPVSIVVHDNGMLSVELPESFHEVSIARLNADGSLSMDCVAPDQVEQALAAAPAPAAAKPALAAKATDASKSDPKRRAAKKSPRAAAPAKTQAPTH